MRLLTSSILTSALLLGLPVFAEDKPADDKPPAGAKAPKPAERVFDPEFEDAMLSEVLQWLQKELGWEWNLSRAAQKACKRGAVTVRVVGTKLSGRQVLDMALAQAGLTWFEKEGGAIEILTLDEHAKDAVLVIHDVRALLAPVPDFEGPDMKEFDIKRAQGGATRPGGVKPVESEHPDGEQAPNPVEDPLKLPELVRDGTGGEEAWIAGTSIDLVRGMLYVKAPRALQVKVRAFLNKLNQFK